MNITKAELQNKFPGFPIYWNWTQVPEGYASKTQLKELKLWKEGIPAKAIKGNSMASPWYYRLYLISDFKTDNQ